jgi:hypothetical protein
MSDVEVQGDTPFAPALSSEAQRFAAVVRCVFGGMLTLCVLMLAVHA